MLWKPLLIFILMMASLFCSESQDQDIWPTEGWQRSIPEDQGINSGLLDNLDRKIADGDYGYVDSWIIIRNGYLIYEKIYDNDYVKINEGKDNRDWMYNYTNPTWHPYYKGTKLHTLQSATKSIAATVIGIAVGKGVLPGVDVKVLDIFKEEEIQNIDEWKSQMTLEDVLTMRSGIDWNESLPWTDPNNSAIQLEASEDWFRFVIDRPMEAEPGTLWEYNSGASMILSAIIKKVTSEDFDAYAEKHLFEPLGITNYFWKVTPTGLHDTEGGLYLEPHDLAKIGHLYLNDGIWEGKRILPEGWVQATVTPYSKDIAYPQDKLNIDYGYQWWLISYEDKPDESVYAARGFGGQYLLVSPRYNLIAVFNGWNIYEIPSIPLRVFFDYIVKATSE